MQQPAAGTEHAQRLAYGLLPIIDQVKDMDGDDDIERGIAKGKQLSIRLYQPQFLELRRKGLIGEERRLDWVEAIRQIQQRRRLLPLSYEIEPQQPYLLETQLSMGDYQLRGSRMALRMDLLHELDLFHFLTDLRQVGTFTVQDCVIRRASNAGTAPLAPTLNAECTLNWVTLTVRPAVSSRGQP